MQTTKIAVIGAGVIGLTSSIRLLEDGFDVTILARDLSPNTTSDVAAAYWLPTGEPKARVVQWGYESHRALTELTKDPVSGVKFRRFHKLSHRPVPDPPYLDILTDFERLDCSKLAGNYSDGIRMTIPLIDTPIYMRYLVQRFAALGGVFEQTTVDSLNTLAESYPLIINCAGVWAGQLANDADCYPMRGQIVRIRKPDGLSPDLFSMTDHDESTYIIPRQNDCVLGGTKLVGDWRVEPDMPTADAIMARCSAFNPLLRNPEIIEHKVGLRPGRSEVRLEVEELSSHCTVIHNYGHGEDGHGMAWGCAAEVTGLAARIQNNGD